MDDVSFCYVGNELELFSGATRWKKYWSGKIRKYFSGSILEVGAGLGTNVSYLWNLDIEKWTCLEADAELAAEIQRRICIGALPANCVGLHGKVQDLPATEQFDTVAYIDVLEHIPDDGEELQRAASRLTAGGRLIVLAPAYNWLLSEFDRAIGHHRRYTVNSLLRLSPASTRCETHFYLDSVGMLASMGNRFLLRQTHPSKRLIVLWDRAFIPLSTVFDRLCNFRFGKTIVVVWRRENRP
ncbi:MAG: class I SAM-dependent methyltransferase [Proteobacteria bacterium]|nr:class I SAM-dependent methyltransferase [Pseudomonadota bacterium]